MYIRDVELARLGRLRWTIRLLPHRVLLALLLRPRHLRDFLPVLVLVAACMGLGPGSGRSISRIGVGLGFWVRVAVYGLGFRVPGMWNHERRVCSDGVHLFAVDAIPVGAMRLRTAGKRALPQSQYQPTRLRESRHRSPARKSGHRSFILLQS